MDIKKDEKITCPARLIVLLIKGKGLSGAENSKLKTLSDEERRKEREKEKEEKEIKKKNFIKKILLECQPLEGTLAEEYLRNIRGIEKISGENLKFHPGFTTRTKTGKYIKVPGLVAVASHPLSSSQNIQITFLDPLTANKHSQVLVSRRTYGGFSSGGVSTFCTISEGKSDVTYVSEGVETGLSLLQVRPHAHVIACLGKHNLPKLDPQTTHHKVVLLWDNDGLEVKSDKVLLRSLEVLKNGGRRTYLLVPPLLQGREKTDLNDILLELGVEGLEDVLQSSLRRVELR
ncbi:uncharacterized protein LOC111698374 [Eurytemora carolleeae]|uniref:uncharacterized protein LOC111698374 n=1 Tax=Eurytemora carolleeae TaxID=1294199 RepID=UPI000C76D4A2|nr:uncharacterized protein LOC111698374 [Eurytemora carolleeae]|eukprot:XP_023324459.1 uncharacterized protein LOC111698374 [Eurytemora affinis]